MHLCPPKAIGWKARASHPSKSCRATSALAGRAYSAAGQAASVLHTMAVLKVCQAKMLASEEAGFDAASLRDLRSATILSLRATKATAQAIERSMSSLVVLERDLWLTMMEMKEADKVPFLDAPVSSNSLFGPAVEGFMEAQKSSQAMQHFLPKRTSSSAASSRPKHALTQQPAKSTQDTPEPRPHKDRQDRECSRSSRRYPFLKRHGPWPKIALDPAPRKSSCSGRQKKEGPESRCHLTMQVKYPLLHTISVLPLFSQSLELFQPCHAGRCLAGDPWCVRVGNGYVKMRLYTPIRWKTITLPRCARHHIAQQGRSSPPRRGDESAAKRSHRSRSSSPERVRLLQPLLPCPLFSPYSSQPILDLRLLNHALVKRLFTIITLKQILSQIFPGDWFLSPDLKDAYFHIQVAPHHIYI